MTTPRPVYIPRHLVPMLHDDFIDSVPRGTMMPDFAPGPELVRASLRAIPELPKGDERR